MKVRILKRRSRPTHRQWSASAFALEVYMSYLHECLPAVAEFASELFRSFANEARNSGAAVAAIRNNEVLKQEEV